MTPNLNSRNAGIFQPAAPRLGWRQYFGRSGTRSVATTDTAATTRSWTLGFAVFCALFLTSSSAAIFMSNSYRSDASVFVKLGRESVALDPTVTTMPTVAINETREFEINSILEVLRSRTIAEKVVDEFGPESILSGVAPGSPPQAPSWMGSMIGSTIDSLRQFNDGREVTLRERAVRRLTKDLDISVPKKTNVLLLGYETKTPEMAQKVLTRVLDILQEEHTRINRMEGTYDFLSTQRELLEEKLNLAEEEMLQEKKQMQLLSIEGARQKLQEEHRLLSQQLIQTNADLVAANAMLNSLQQGVQELPDRLPLANTTGLPNEATDRMRDILYQLQIREQDLGSKYHDSHPQLMQVRRQVKEAEAVYNLQSTEREQTTTEVHPSKQKLELLYMTEKTNVASLTSRLAKLEEQLTVTYRNMELLNENEIRIGELQRKIDLATFNLRNYSEKLEQSRLDRELMLKNISNLNVVQQASYVEKPVSPPRLILLVGGLFFAIVGGLGAALINDFKSWFAPESQISHRRIIENGNDTGAASASRATESIPNEFVETSGAHQS